MEKNLYNDVYRSISIKQKIITVFLSVMLVLVCIQIIFVIAVNNASQDNITLEDEALLRETDAVTQKDLDDDFQNYASDNASVTFSTEAGFYSDATLANVVGIVKDYHTDVPISNAIIFVDGAAIVSTDSNGRFAISNMPSETYNWDVSAEGYCTGTYENYNVDGADGTTIFTFYVSNNFEVYKDRNMI